jgi:hypothetical protein
MELRTRFWLATLATAAAFAGPAAPFSEAQIKIEYAFPHHVPRGQTTLVSVAVPTRDNVQSAEISPSAGITVAGLKLAENAQGVGWWLLTLNVATDATPGDRSLVLVMPNGRTLPYTIAVPNHVPAISDLKVLSGTASKPALELQFAATDPSSDLGATPYVWFTIGCVPEPIVGAVRGQVSAGTVRARIPDPRTLTGDPPKGPCNVQVRTSDTTGIESNTLKTTIDFKN